MRVKIDRGSVCVEIERENVQRERWKVCAERSVF